MLDPRHSSEVPLKKITRVIAPFRNLVIFTSKRLHSATRSEIVSVRVLQFTASLQGLDDEKALWQILVVFFI